MPDQLNAEAVLARRDPALLRRLVPVGEALGRYFRPEVRGVERLPSSGPYLLVGVHSGGIFMPDALALVVAWLKRQPDTELFLLAYDLLFAVPGVAAVLERFGVVPASPPVAEAALARGAVVMVFPGGDVEDCRRWQDRHHVDLGGHTGFVRVALRTGVPIVPVVSHGAHEAELILLRGTRLAHAMRIDRLLRVHVFPFVLGLPFGVVPIFVPHLPLPAHVTVEILDPMHLTEAPDAAAADDPTTVERWYTAIVATLQTALDRLAATPALPLLDPPPRAREHEHEHEIVPLPVGVRPRTGGASPVDAR
jgi:1-acyl-sn-glycerol-3-phosphate acyltransferase